MPCKVKQCNGLHAQILVKGFVFVTSIFNFVTLCVWMLLLHVCLHMCMPGTGVIDSYEPPCGCWKSRLSLLEKCS